METDYFVIVKFYFYELSSNIVKNVIFFPPAAWEAMPDKMISKKC